MTPWAGAEGSHENPGKPVLDVALLADPLYLWLAAGTFRYTAELTRAVAAIPDVRLRLVTTVSGVRMSARAAERSVPLAENVGGAFEGTLRQLRWMALAGRAEPWAAHAAVVHVPWLAYAPHPRGRLVVTIHDAIPWTFPRHVPWRTKLLSRLAIWRLCGVDATFIADSSTTATDILRLGLAPGRVQVVPLAADERFSPGPSTASRRWPLLGGDYILFVGTLEPRKNVDALLSAVGLLRSPRPRLVLAGRPGWLGSRTRAKIDALAAAGEVLVVDSPSDEEVVDLMRGATVFAYPSWYEGFGLPVLEAMQSGAPVVCSRTSSLPEVGGAAPLYVDPADASGLAAAIQRVLDDRALREDMRATGLAQAGRFTWAHTAELTAEVYRDVAARG